MASRSVSVRPGAAGDTEGVILAVRPRPSNRTRRMLWWLLPVAAAAALWVTRRAAGDATGEVTKILLGTSAIAIWFLSLAVLTDRWSRRSELALLTHGRVRAKSGSRQRVIAVRPGGGFRMTLDPGSAATAAGTSPRNSVWIAGAITPEDARRLTDALFETVPGIWAEVVIVEPSRPWKSIPLWFRNRRFDRLTKKVGPVLEELIGTGHLKARRVTLSALNGVIEVAVEGDAAAARALLAEKLPMDYIRVFDATRK